MSRVEAATSLAVYCLTSSVIKVIHLRSLSKTTDSKIKSLKGHYKKLHISTTSLPRHLKLCHVNANVIIMIKGTREIREKKPVSESCDLQMHEVVSPRLTVHRI